MKNTGLYPKSRVDVAPVSAVGQAGGVLLTGTVRVTGLDRALSDALAGWRKPFAVHDPGKVLTDLAIALALGGDALADVGVLRGEPSVYGHVASDPTVFRLIAALVGDADRAVAAISSARAAGRARAWTLAGEHAPDAAATVKDPLVIDLDATLITAHSEKEQAAATFKRGYGFHPLCAFLDHGQAGSGEALVIKLRPGNAGSNTAADHIDVVKQALAQLPGGSARPGKKVLIRADGAGGTRQFITWLTGRRLAELELRHRRRARCEDRIRLAKDTGLRNLPLHGFAQNRIWCQLVALASELTAWMGMLGHPTAEARRWEPKRLRLRLYSIPAALARTGRRVVLHLWDRARWIDIAIAAISRLRALPAAPG